MCGARRLSLFSLTFSSYFPPIPVLSPMAPTLCWGSVVAEKLIVWPLGASVETCSRDNDKSMLGGG